MAKATTAPADEDLELEYDGETLTDRDEILQRLDGWDQLSRDGYPTSRNMQAVKQAADPNTMSASFVIVTRTKELNRHGNQVQIVEGPNGRGLVTDAYEQNPVVMFDHGFGLALPIGKCRKEPGAKLDLTLQKSKAVSTCYFSQSLPDAAVIFGLIDEDILRMASIQYLPFKAMRLSRKGENLPEGVEECRWNGWDFTESELMEWSVVAIGADPGAIRKSIDRGKINGYRIGPALRQGLSQYAEQPKAMGVGISLAPPEERGPTPMSLPAIQEAVRLTVQAELQAFRAMQSAALPAAVITPPVDTPPANVTNAQTVATRLPTGEEIAAAYRQQATQHDTTVEIARQLPGLIRQEVEAASKPILEQQQALHDRIKQLRGRV